MKEVLCWCCEYFWQESELDGKCKLYFTKVSPSDRVCRRFLLNSGLHTERKIPDYCENYKDEILL